MRMERCETAGREKLHAVTGITHLTDSVFVLRLERNGFRFVPGQHLRAGRGNDLREYSIFSGVGDPFLDILVKRMDGGAVSPMLASRSPGDLLAIEGPFGDFTLPAGGTDGRKFLFVATGTGISPYRSIVRSNGRLEYRVLHGVRKAEERYGREEFEPGRYIACVTKESGSDFPGRVTDFLRGEPIDPSTECYLCGNSDMIYEAFRILSGYGVPRARIRAEIYF